MQSYSTIAAKLMGGSQVFETSDSAIQIEMVKGHLERWSEVWLLVFDNYDDPQKFPEVEQFIPISRRCSVISCRSVADTRIRRMWSRTVHQPQ